MKKPFAQRHRERYAAIKAKRYGTPKPPPVEVVEEDIEDASELEYQEKTTRKKRSNTRRKNGDN